MTYKGLDKLTEEMFDQWLLFTIAIYYISRISVIMTVNAAEEGVKVATVKYLMLS